MILPYFLFNYFYVLTNSEDGADGPASAQQMQNAEAGAGAAAAGGW